MTAWSTRFQPLNLHFGLTTILSLLRLWLSVSSFFWFHLDLEFGLAQECGGLQAIGSEFSSRLPSNNNAFQYCDRP
jgi:hypothetical protein